jgi:hypothetical protein
VNLEVDIDGARKVADDLADVDAARFRPVVAKGALNVKNALQREARSAGHYKHFHRSISYELLGDLEAEIGPDKDRVQGALGNILYFGTSKNAAVLDLDASLAREAPRFELALADVAEDVL